QQEDDQDDDDEAGPAARVVAPPAAVRPRRQRADQNQDQDDQKNSAHRAARLWLVFLLPTRRDDFRFRLRPGSDLDLPVTKGPAIDVDKIGARIIADTAGAQA